MIEVLPHCFNDEILLFKHTVTVDNFCFSSVQKQIFRVHNNDAKPMRKSIDRENNKIFLKKICVFGPSLHLLVVLPDPLDSVWDQLTWVNSGDSFLFHKVSNDFFHQEGREDVEVRRSLRQKYQLKYSQVVANNCVIEICVRLEFFHILHWKREAQLFVVELELKLGFSLDINFNLLRVTVFVKLSPSTVEFSFLLLLKPLEKLILAPIAPCCQFEVHNSGIYSLVQSNFRNPSKNRSFLRCSFLLLFDFIITIPVCLLFSIVGRFFMKVEFEQMVKEGIGSVLKAFGELIPLFHCDAHI